MASVIVLAQDEEGREWTKADETERKRQIAGPATVTRKRPVFVGVS